MRKQLLFLLLTLVSSSLYSQTWAPVGATWTYNYSSVNQVGPYTHYTVSPVQFTVVTDTLINGQLASKVTGDGNCWANTNPSYMYESNRVVYIYSPQLNSFRPMINFNSNVGDSFYMNYVDGGQTDSIQLQVDSIATRTINSVQLRSMYVRTLNSFDYTFFGWVTERIGGDHTLFPFYGACDPYAAGLRCYSDAQISTNLDTRFPDCDSTYQWTTVGISESRINRLTITPNPATELVSFNNNSTALIQIYTLTGAVVLEKLLEQDEKLDISGLKPGIYFTSVSSSSITNAGKLIKR